MQQNPTNPTPNYIKSILKRINLSLQLYNMNRHPNIWHSIYKWNYDHNLLKNLLKLTNKTLKGLNKYHVFKIDYIYMMIGMALGYFVSQTQKYYQHLQQLQVKPTIRQLLINNVLKNSQISTKLKQAVNDNILTNQDIQTNLHFILINKIFQPQQQNLKKLIKTSVLTGLKSQHLYQYVQSEVIKGIQKNRMLIALQAFKFLRSDIMLNIITTNVAPLIKSQQTQYQVSKLLKQLVNSQLKNQQNQQTLYQFLREKIIF